MSVFVFCPCPGYKAHTALTNGNPRAVAGELLEQLGTTGAPLAAGLLLRLGEMCAGASDAAEEEEALDDAISKDALAAQNALGQGIRAMGPEAVLQVLPLGLVEVRCAGWLWVTHCNLQDQVVLWELLLDARAVLHSCSSGSDI